MLIALALIFAASVGIGVHYAMPERTSRGVAFAPMIAAALAGLTWTSMTWLGIREDNLWIWLVSCVAPIIVTVLVLAVMTRARAAHDARERVRLRIA